MLIGNSQAFSSQGWVGKIDDIRIYNKALSVSEIDSLYHEGGWPPPEPVTAAHWTFDEMVGDTLHDVSGNGNHGIISGATWVNGIRDGALKFDGIDDYVETPLIPVYNNTESFTWEVIARFTEGTGTTMDMMGFEKSFNGEIDIVARADGFIRGFARSDDYANDGGQHILDSDSAMNDGKWHHYALVRDRANLLYKLYVDHLFVAQIADNNLNSINALGQHWLPIAAHNANGTISRQYKGSIDEVRISNVALNLDQFLEFTPDTSVSIGLVAYYPFNGNANDESGNGHDGTVNGPTLTEDRFGNDSSAYTFNDNNINIGQGFDNANGSVSAWIYMEGTGIQRFLSDRSGASDYLSLFTNGSNEVGGTMYGDSGFIGIGQTDTLLVSKWYHIVYSWGSGGSKLYINNTLNDSDPNTQSWTANSDMLIGNSQAFSSQGWVGKIDDIRIYNKALSVSEIDSLYHEGGWPSINAPIISDIEDVPDDQGGWIYLRWLSSGQDAIGNITQYGVWELNPENEWVSLGNVPSIQLDNYTYLAHTFADSNHIGDHLSLFMVTAHTTDPTEFYISGVDSGYSVDNLAPVAPTGLIASVVDTSIKLIWNHSVDEDFDHFRVYRSVVPSDSQLYAETGDTMFTDTETVIGQTYYYKISAVDFNGNESEYSEEVKETIVGVEDERTGIPKEFALDHNYPNPFNPVTTIQYALPKRADVSLVIYNILGEEVKRFAEIGKDAGYHELVWDASGAASGVYLYRLRAGPPAGGFIQTKKMLLLK